FGYDMLSEPVRRAAMERARDLDTATLSGKVTLVQETDEDVQAGTLMYVPVYRIGMPTGTVDQRRAALQGWVYSPYRMTDLMRGILGGWGLMTDRRIRLQVFDGQTAAPGALLYDSESASGQAAGSAGRFTLENRLVVADSPWTLRFTKTGGQTFAGDYTKTWIVIFSGTFASLLLCILFFILVETRSRANQRAQRLATDLGRSDEQSRRSARLLQTVIDHSQCLVYAKDSEGRFVLASQPLASFFGQNSHEQLLGKTSHDFLPPAIADQHRANDLAVMASGALIQAEETVETPDGRLTFLSTKFPILDDHAGTNTVCGVSFDITKRKEAEKVLATTTNLLERMGEIAKVGGWELDLTTNRLFSSREALRISEVEPLSEITMEQAIGLISAEARPAIESAVQSAIATGTPWDLEVPFTTAKGRHLWVRSQGSTVMENGKAVKLCGAFQDITAGKDAAATLLRQAAELRERNDELERFNHLMVGRELRVIDLKQKLNNLSAELGRPCPYPLAFLDEGSGEAIRSVAAPEDSDRPL
ncbi:MAG: CHASE domain-containing protein, partial [Verrucomicrobiota bacterium]